MKNLKGVGAEATNSAFYVAAKPASVALDSAVVLPQIVIPANAGNRA
jgi:hypothetical protein